MRRGGGYSKSSKMCYSFYFFKAEAVKVMGLSKSTETVLFNNQMGPYS